MASRKGHLIAIRGGPKGAEPYPIGADRTLIGREADCDVQLAVPEVSRKHAELVWEGDDLVLHHRSSVNPTKVNGELVTERRTLAHGDEIEFAETVALRLELERAPLESAATLVPGGEDTVVPGGKDTAVPGGKDTAVPKGKDAVVPDAAATVAPAAAKPDATLAAPAEATTAPSAAAAEGDEPAKQPAKPSKSSKPAAKQPAAKPADESPAKVPANVNIAIVGAGPAGLAAAVQAAIRKVPHTLLERSKLANTIEKYQKGKWVMDEPPRLSLQEELAVGFVAGSREDVLAEWNRGVEAAGCNLERGSNFELTKIEGEKGNFKLTLKSGETRQASHIVLSIGVQGNLRTFGVDGDNLPHVTYQLDDPAEHTGKKVVVVGVGDAGIENALALVEHDNDVAIVNRREEFDRAKPRNRTLMEGAIKAGDITHYTNSTTERFEPGAIVLRTNNGEERLEADLVIGRLGAIPPRKFLEDIGVEFASDDRSAVPEVSGSYETNVPGIYLIGALAGYPLIKNCMNQGFEVVEHIIGNTPTPADEPVLREKFEGLQGSVAEILDQIRQRIPVFRGLTTIQLREFLFDSDIRQLEPGEVVFERNDFTNTFLSILDGRVEATLPQSDEDAELDREAGKQTTERKVPMGVGEFFGEGGLISGRRRGATVTAAEKSTLIESPRIAMNKLVKSVDEVRRVIDQTFIARTLENLVPSVSVEERKALAESAEIRTYKPSEALFAEGDDPDGLHLIRRGSVTISQRQEGQEKIVQYVQAGNYIGEMALLAPDRKRGATVTASVLTETVLLPTDAIVPFLIAHPQVRQEFERTGSDRAMEEAARAGDKDRGTVMFLMKETGAKEATDLLLIDESLCIRCNNCEAACADTHEGVSRLDREAGPTYQTSGGSQLHIPTACQHCENPKCMDDCPPDALRRHPTGEVYIKDNCIGCGNCVANCPYDVIQMAAVEEYKRPTLLWRLLFGERKAAKSDDHGDEPHAEHAVKCDLCRNLPAPRGGGARAACVASCPTGAIVRVNPRALVDEILERQH